MISYTETVVTMTLFYILLFSSQFEEFIYWVLHKFDKRQEKNRIPMGFRRE